jgi:hypothetical protein
MTKTEEARRKTEARVYRAVVGERPDSKWKSLLPLLTERGFASRVIRKRLNLPTPLDTTDRWILEQRIFPHYLSNPAIRNVLFVGCDFYTTHYQRMFFSAVNFATIEPDPARRRFAANRHAVAPLEKLGDHFAPGEFDLVICNGVYGWGLDSLEQCDAAFYQCHACMANGGQLILGWDDVPRRTPVPLTQISSLALFRKYVFPEFGTWRYVTDTPYRHTYDFYEKSQDIDGARRALA